jgi:divalent metal cation (Fe/Co/Zn/Cd) transporter
MIARFGLDTLFEGIKGISDRSFDKQLLTDVRNLVLNEEGIKDLHRLRARQIGQKHWIDLEAKFDPQAKVCEVREIIANVKQNVMGHFEDVADVVIVSRVAEPELKEL